MSLMTSFNSGVAGIHAAQSGLNTTAHNLSNAKTPGYTRQQNIQTDFYYNFYKYGRSRMKMQIGMGTMVSDIRQIRDEFLDTEYRLEFGRQKFYEKLVETQQEVEDIFGEMEGVQFQYNLTELWSAFQNLSTAPEDITNRQLLISTADSFLESARNVYDSLETYQVSLNTEIKDQVDAINEIGEKIAICNLEISRSEASGLENANDYRDMRNLLMDQLGGYVNYTSQEDSDGRVQIYIENALFVAEGRSYHMGCEKMVPSDMYNVVWTDNGYGNVFDISEAYSSQKKTDVGSLRGILTARGLEVADYADMPIEPKKEDFANEANPDEAYKIAMNTFRDELKVYNNTTANSIITKIQAQFDQLIHGIVTTINDALCPNIDASLTGIAGKDIEGKDVTLEDGNYKILDVLNCPYGTDDAETIGTELFSRSQIDRYQIITLDGQIYGKAADGSDIALARDNGDGTYSLYVYNEEDTSDIDWMYGVRSLVLNPDMAADYSLLEVKANPNQKLEGAYNYATQSFKEILNKWSEPFAVLDPNTLASYNFDQYYTNLIGDLGTQGDIWKSMEEHQTSLSESVEDKRQQVAGVSTEEELVTLLQYQHAYNAASRYITTIDDMLRHLIERLG